MPHRQEMEDQNYTQVLIDGKIYTLGGSEDEAYLQKAASYVNEKITTMHALPGFSKQSADYQQLMLLLNIADDYFKTKETADQMEEQRDRMEKETYSLKHELVSTQMKLGTPASASGIICKAFKIRTGIKSCKEAGSTGSNI